MLEVREGTPLRRGEQVEGVGESAGSNFVCAAASARLARCVGSGVSAAARSRKAAAAASPPGAWGRSGGPLELSGDILVRAGRRLGQRSPAAIAAR
jgi:hypothetical protein